MKKKNKNAASKEKEQIISGLPVGYARYSFCFVVCCHITQTSAKPMALLHNARGLATGGVPAPS